MLKRRAHHEPVNTPDEEAEISASLSAIYGEERDDLKIVARGGSRLTLFLFRLVVTLSILCVLTAIGFFVYQRFFVPQQTGKPLAISFVVPDELQSGAPATIELDYVNQTSYPLTGVEVDVNLPSGFVLRQSTPAVTSAADMVWDLGTISGKSDGKIIIDGVWNVDVPSTAGIQALVYYQPANFNAPFHDIATKSVMTNMSTTSVVVDAPATVNVGESTTYTIHVKNTGLEPLVAPNVSVALPTGFFVQSSVPAILPGEAVGYVLSDIAPGVESTIVLTGAFASDVLGLQTMAATSGIGGTRLSPQAVGTGVTDVKGSALALTMVGNGMSGTVVADPGSLFRLTARVENTSDAPVSDAALLFNFSAEDNIPIDWKTAVLAGGRATSQGIVFDAKTLGTIAPGDHKVLNLGFPLKSDLSAVSSAFSVVLTATRGSITVSTAPMTVTLNSDASLSSVLRFYDTDGSALGSGSLPPTVGKATHYRGVWTIGSGLHGLNDVTVTATLPDDVAWDDFSTATSGSVVYDPTSRVITWKLSSIPGASAAVTARFSVSITPVSADVGLTKTMVGKATLRAKDDVTNAAIERTTDVVTTACDGDVLVSGKGMVKN